MTHSDILETISRIKASARLFILNELIRLGIEDMAPSHGAVLACLVKAGGPVPVTNLVLALKRPKSTITKTTDSLERGGYLSKKPNPADGRSYLVTLTPKGRECYAQFEEIMLRLEQKILGGLSREDGEALIRLLRMVEDNLA